MPNTPRKQRLKSLEDIDLRTNSAKRAKSLLNGLQSDLGGADVVSVAQAELTQRAAILGAVIADFEARWLSGEVVDFSAWFSAINRQTRVLEQLGIERRPKPVMDLKTYLGRTERK